MKITLLINGADLTKEVRPEVSLLTVLRDLGFHGVKFGDEQGVSGSDTILMDGRPVNAGLILAAQAEGHKIATIEALGEHPFQGWRKTGGLHPIQKAFIENGSIQCGYCTPAQVLAAKALLDTNPSPSEDEVRAALSGILCRCTGYAKPVQAVLKAAAVMRGEVQFGSMDSPAIDNQTILASRSDRDQSSSDELLTKVMPKVILAPETSPYQIVGKPEIKVDAIKLVQGKPAFTADVNVPGLLHAKVLRSPHAHARISKIDTSKAKELKGVAAVLTLQDIPRVVYSTAGQSDPIPGPLDTFSLDNKVRFVGDRVAFVAA
jgi:putative selenate reductase molybdopterin-binding subunit